MNWKNALKALIVLALVVVACGDSAPVTEIDVTTSDFMFSPDKWTVAAGEEITINISNDGAVTHEWVILQDGVRIESEADLPETEEELLADFVYWEEEIESGDSGSFTFTAPAAGTYQIICAIETHFDAGMHGSLTVAAS